MKAHLLHAVGTVFAAVVASVMANSDVKETTSHYSCCENPAISFDQRCENTWNNNDMTIAYYKETGKQKCFHPCKKIKDGQMLLDECADVTATIVCPNGKNVVEERIRHYSSLPCSGARSAAVNQGSICLMLLAALIGALFMGMIG